MTTTTKTKLTLEQFLALPETKPASEYGCGEVIQKPMPNRPHSRLQIYLGMLLLQVAMRAKLGEVVTECRCIFGPPGRERAFVPDIVFVAQERIGTDQFYLVAPDLAVEILSPGQSAVRFARKLLFYLTHGVKLVWVIDPEEQTVSVLEPGQDERVLRTGDTLDGGAVLPGFAVAVDDLITQM